MDTTTRLGTAADPVVLDEIAALSCGDAPPRSGPGVRRLFPRSRTSKFGTCDSNSYCLSCMSVIFVGLGAFITVTTLGGTKFSLGHMWSVGPIFFCVGIMMAMKCYVYLRSKREIEMLFIAEIVCEQMMRLEDEGRRRLAERSRHLFNSHGLTREIFTLVTDQVLTTASLPRERPPETPRSLGDRPSPVARNNIPSPATVARNNIPPPCYDAVARHDAPPPSYTEAVALMHNRDNKPPHTVLQIESR